MRNGNPNQKANAYQPTAWGNSRAVQGRNPMGVGAEALQGGVPQPPKINSIPGFGSTRPAQTQTWGMPQKPTRVPLTPADGAGVRERALAQQGISYGGSQGVADANTLFANGTDPNALRGFGWTQYAGYTLNGQPVPIEQYAEAYRLAYGDKAYQLKVASGEFPAPTAADLLGY